MRVIAVLAVIMLHSAAHGVTQYGRLASGSWWTANWLDSACRWCVPVFIMLSGALILDPSREESLAVFYQKRFLRVFVPLLFGSTFYFIWSATFRGEAITFEYVRRQLLAGMTDYHLYFLFLILGLYLVAPILKIYVKYGKSGEQWTIAGLLFALNAASLLAGNQGFNAFSMYFPYLSYFWMGYLLRNRSLGAIGLFITFAVFFSSVAMTALGTGWLYAHYDPNPLILYDHLSPTVIAETLSAFLLIRSFFSAKVGALFVQPMQVLGPATLGIYLIHVAVLDVLRGWTSPFYAHEVLQTVLLEVAITFTLSAAITLILRRIQSLRYLIG